MKLHKALCNQTFNCTKVWSNQVDNDWLYEFFQKIRSGSARPKCLDASYRQCWSFNWVRKQTGSFTFFPIITLKRKHAQICSKHKQLLFFCCFKLIPSSLIVFILITFVGFVHIFFSRIISNWLRVDDFLEISNIFWTMFRMLFGLCFLELLKIVARRGQLSLVPRNRGLKFTGRAHKIWSAFK